MSEKIQENQEILKRLDIIIRLLLRNMKSKESNLLFMEQIGLLKEIGLSTADISKITGKPSNYVSSVIKHLSKKRG